MLANFRYDVRKSSAIINRHSCYITSGILASPQVSLMFGFKPPSRQSAVCCCAIVAAAYTNRGGRPVFQIGGLSSQKELHKKSSLAISFFGRHFQGSKCLFIYDLHGQLLQTSRFQHHMIDTFVGVSTIVQKHTAATNNDYMTVKTCRTVVPV